MGENFTMWLSRNCHQTLLSYLEKDCVCGVVQQEKGRTCLLISLGFVCLSYYHRDGAIRYLQLSKVLFYPEVYGFDYLFLSFGTTALCVSLCVMADFYVNWSWALLDI